MSLTKVLRIEIVLTQILVQAKKSVATWRQTVEDMKHSFALFMSFAKRSELASARVSLYLILTSHTHVKTGQTFPIIEIV